RRLYEEALKGDPTSAEALRGAARAAAGAGDRDAALGYWRRALEASPPGGTAWYEARLAEVALLAQDGRKTQACDLIRTSRGRATWRATAGDPSGEPPPVRRRVPDPGARARPKRCGRYCCGSSRGRGPRRLPPARRRGRAAPHQGGRRAPAPRGHARRAAPR